MGDYTLEELLDLRNIAQNNLMICPIITGINKYNAEKTREYIFNLRYISNLTNSKIKVYILIYDILYRYTLKHLILYLNSEFEPIVYWRFSINK